MHSSHLIGGDRELSEVEKQDVGTVGKGDGRCKERVLERPLSLVLEVS